MMHALLHFIARVACSTVETFQEQERLCFSLKEEARKD